MKKRIISGLLVGMLVMTSFESRAVEPVATYDEDMVILDANLGNSEEDQQFNEIEDLENSEEVLQADESEDLENSEEALQIDEIEGLENSDNDEIVEDIGIIDEVETTELTASIDQDKRLLAEVTPITDRSDFKEFIAIHNRKELEAINDDLNGKYYLANDIDLSGKEWTPIGYIQRPWGVDMSDFRGILDGQGHTIKNMMLNPNELYAKNYGDGAGLFAAIGDSFGSSWDHLSGDYAIQNLIMENISINVSCDFDGIAALVGKLDPLEDTSSVLFYNIVVSGKISGPDTVGSIIGAADNSKCKISNCSNYASITAKGGFAGGILSDGYGTIENCENYGNVEGQGGIAGGFKGSIYNCKNYGNVSGIMIDSGTYEPIYEMKESIGGITGVLYNYSDDDSYPELKKCQNFGTVKAGDNKYCRATGGIAGYVANTVISDCINFGEVSGAEKANYTTAYTGGIVGSTNDYNNEKVLLKGCQNNGNISGDMAGGIGGKTGSLLECTNSGSITDGAGIVACCEDGKIESCVNNGRIEGTRGSGIVIGADMATILKCKNFGEIVIRQSATDDSSGRYIGGIAGKSGTVTDCENYGEISVNSEYTDWGGTVVGGIIADSSEVKNCVNHGFISSNCTTGGIVGNAYLITKCRNEGGISVSCDNSKEVICGGIAASGSVTSEQTYTVDECSNYGDISVELNSFHVWEESYTVRRMYPPEPKVGGIVGNLGDITNCYNSGDIYIENSALGTEVYDEEWSIDNYMFGALAGGIAGYAIDIANCYNVGDVVARASSGFVYAGGVIGYGGGYRSIDFRSEREKWDKTGVNKTISLSSTISSDFTDPVVEDQKRQKKANAIGNFLNATTADDNLWRSDGTDQESGTDFDVYPPKTVWYGSGYEPSGFYEQTPYTELGWNFDDVWTWPEKGGLPVLKWENLSVGPFMREVTEGGNSSYVAEGKVGNITWRIYRKVTTDGDSYSLKLEGTGEMPDFTEGEQPWNAYKDRIISISIDQRITSIGAYAFAGFEKEDIDISLKSRITKIGTGAFMGSPGFKWIVLPRGLTTIVEGNDGSDTAFSGCNDLLLGTWIGSYGLEYAKKHNLKYVLITETIVEELNTSISDSLSKVQLRYTGETGEKYQTVSWGGRLFENPSGAYNNDTALAAAVISAMIETDETASTDQVLRIQENFHSLGFHYENIAIGNYKHDLVPGLKMHDYGMDGNSFGGSYAYAIAADSINVGGDYNNLIIIAARGSATPFEFAWDGLSFNRYYDEFGYYIYENAYTFYRSILYGFSKYLETHEFTLTDGSKSTLNDYLNSGTNAKLKCKILLTGHSLGGAATDLVAHWFNANSPAVGWGGAFDKSDVHAYTFGAINAIAEGGYERPWVWLHGCPVAAGYENIHNVYNFYDTFGPKGHNSLATERWFYHIGSGYGKFGHLDLFEAKYDDSHNMYYYIDAIKFGHVDYNYHYKKDIWQQEHLYACPVDIDVYKSDQLVGRVKDDVVDETVTQIPMFVDEEGVKHILLTGLDSDYSIRITSTAEGTMNAFINDINDASGYKNIEGIKLETGKTFEVQVKDGVKASEEKILVLDDDSNPVREVIENGQEVKYHEYGEVLESDIPVDGIIPDGIWVAGVKDLSFTGKKLTQNFRVYDGTVMLTPKTDYTVAYKNNKKAYTIADPENLTAGDKKSAPNMTISMKGNYSGKQTVYFSIIQSGEFEEEPGEDKAKPYPMTGDKISVTDLNGNTELSADYNKSGAKPGIRVIYEDTILKEGRDYVLKYSGNTKYPAKKATVTISGKGRFTGKVNKVFTVTQRSFSESEGITVVASDISVSKKAGQYKTTVKVFDSEGKLLKAGTDYDKNLLYLKDGVELTKTDFPKAGDIITVRVTGKGGYSESYIETTYKVLDKNQIKDISKATIKIKPQSYNKGIPVIINTQDQLSTATIGKTKTQLILCTGDSTTGDFKVVPGSYVKNTAKGTAKVTFMGINGYTGVKTVSYKIGTRSLGDWWKGIFKK